MIPASRWQFQPPPDDAEDLVAVGADLAPETVVAAYRAGYFPMPVGRRAKIGWFSPNPRGIIPPGRMHQSRSLTRSMRRFEVRFDTRFDDVVAACADVKREHGWISSEMAAMYHQLFVLGIAHSTEVLLDGQLVGGLFGIRIGRFFAGESMFHSVTDASKAAMVATDAALPEDRLFDVQWTTDHLKRMGAIDVPRAIYLRLLERRIDD